MVNRKGSDPPHDEIVNQPDGLPPKTTMIQSTIVSQNATRNLGSTHFNTFQHIQFRYAHRRNFKEG